MRFFKSYSPLFRFFLSHSRWKGKNRGVIYVTFDDGPHPEITTKTLEILDRFHVKATFFCVGENISKYPDIFNKIIEAGHSVGNHTYDHKKGWESSIEEYTESVEKAQQLYPFTFFRPPYGKIRPRQIAKLPKGLRLIMWTLLSYDFDQTRSPELSLKRMIRKTRNGTVVVFHDSEKAKENMLYILPRYLEYFTKLGYRFENL